MLDYNALNTIAEPEIKSLVKRLFQHTSLSEHPGASTIK